MKAIPMDSLNKDFAASLLLPPFFRELASVVLIFKLLHVYFAVTSWFSPITFNGLSTPQTKWSATVFIIILCTIFTTRREICPPGPYEQCATPPTITCQVSRAAQTHFRKTKQLWITITKMYWLLIRKSKLSTSNKLLVHKIILKRIWTYGIQLWGMASSLSIEILEHLQSKSFHMIVNAPWYLPNTVIRRDLQISTVKEEIRRYSSQYSARLGAYPNWLSSTPHGATRQQAIEKTPTKWSAYQIPSVITDERYWALFYMPQYVFFYTSCLMYW
jgi:hypothetical protein